VTASAEESVRLAELVAAISLATDLGTGQPLEHGLQTCYLAMGLAREADLSVGDLSDTFYVSLLRFLGCTSEASEDAAMNAGDEIAFYEGLAPLFMGGSPEIAGWLLRHLAEQGSRMTRVRSRVLALADVKGAERSIRAHCEVGQMLASRIGLGDSVQHALGCAFERWDGKGLPRGIAAEEIPASSRVAIVARDYELLHRTWGGEVAEGILRARKGKAYDPKVLEVALAHGPRLLEEINQGSLWERVLDAEVGPPMTVDQAQVDNALRAFADFVDLKSPFLHGHSAGVATLAQRAAGVGGASPRDATHIWRAGLVHDLGRVAVPSGIWNKTGPLSDEEWERVRLHSYYTDRIVVRCGPLDELAEIASSHHERADGSGYHRGLRATSLSASAKLLAAADAYRAMTEPRPHRTALSAHQAAEELNRVCEQGRLDVPSTRAVLEAAGEKRKPGRSAWPAGLTDREVEVLRLIGSGLSNKQVARRLTLSPKTVSHHVEHIYAKVGVSTRAGATLFAMQEGMIGD
jgi:HD-GYP domain-containing protein (c-di-GMP phosphodiesterase class II)/DNA-binding CsgD family transcriptional regulator